MVKRIPLVKTIKLAKKVVFQTVLVMLLGGSAFAEDAVNQMPIEIDTAAQEMPSQLPIPPLRILPPSPKLPSNINSSMPINEATSGNGLQQNSGITEGVESSTISIPPNQEVIIRSTPQESTPVLINPSLQPAIQSTVMSGNGNTPIAEIPNQKALQKIEPGTAALNFSEASLRDILRTVADITGENFIVAPGVSARITVQTTKPVPKKDIFSIFESILEINGLAAVKSGSYYKIVQAPSVKQRGLDLIDSSYLPEIPSGDKMVNVIVPVEFISGNELMQILKPMLSQAGNITLYSKANTLILTDTASNIKKALEFIEILDADAFKRMHIEIVTAQNVDSRTLNKEINDIFSALGFGKDASQLTVIPIERLNSLIILSSSDQLLSSVKEWIERLDKRSSGEGSSIHIYYVQNDKASNLKAILEQVFGGKKAIPLLSGNPVPPLAAQQQFIATSSGQAGDEIKIFIYEPSNALIIQASQRDYQSILNTIRELDRIPKQVLIDALILEVKLDESTKFGIQWSALTGNFNLQQNTGIFSSTINDPRGGISTPIGLSTPSGLSAFTTDSSKFFAAIQALASTGKIDVLSNPHIVVKNYEKASINVGSDEPVATQSTQTAVTGTAGLIQNIEYRKTGVILTVTPHITEGGMVAMTLRQEVSDKSTDRTVGDSTYPSFTKREAETSVVAKDRETLVIGGLIQERKENAYSGIPLLSRIPLLGNLFKFTTLTEGKTELIILITPRVISDSAQASLITNEMKNKLEDIKNHFLK
ncbi:MAG: type II secretion system secretin GspD [Deltaproteobacteria bacterium]|nr:type II secretion system secretin GspD [Deltaproteobacteria bacterium]